MPFLLSLLLACSLSCNSFATVAWNAKPFDPPSVPLAVRTPYLSAWLPQGSGAALNDVWPTFWTGSILGWAGYIKVDNATYSFLGAPNIPGFTKATQKRFEFTATQSKFVLSAGPVDLSVNFLSPMEPHDILRQSLPFSYVTLSVASTDGDTHDVKLYTDITAEWVSEDNGLLVNWTTTVSDNIIIHQTQLLEQWAFSEINDRIQHGSAFYSTSTDFHTTYKTGDDVTVRSSFISNGVLDNNQDTNFRAINDNWPVFAFAHNLRKVTSQTKPIVISVGHARDPTFEYIVDNGVIQHRSPYFLAQYASAAHAIIPFLTEYPGALERANVFDARVKQDANSISAGYVGLVELSIRQAFGAIEITVSKNDVGYNVDDILVFMKEISSDGNVNTIDVVFPAWPIFLYTNPVIGKYLLLPHYQYQASGQYPNKWALHDMGAHYPNATGHNDGLDEPMPVEESGNHLIMALSYTRRTGDKPLIVQYSGLLDQWTQFLIRDSLVPENQLSTDDFAGRLENQTNLAIKGIIGIQAAADIFRILGDEQKADNYSSIVASYVPQWEDLAYSSNKTHLTLSYGKDATWGLAYNLLGEKLTGINIFPRSVYDAATAWYKERTTTYGIPLDTRSASSSNHCANLTFSIYSHTYTKSDWEIWTAAVVTDEEVRNALIESVVAYASNGLNGAPLNDWYETLEGAVSGFRARPVVGGHLALLVVPDAL